MDYPRLQMLIDGGSYDLALQEVNQLLARSESSEKEQLRSLLVKSKILRLMGSLNDSHMLLLELMDKTSRYPLMHYAVLVEYAYTLFGFHKFNESRISIQKAEQLWDSFQTADQDKNRESYATLLHIKGILTLKTGEISKGLLYLEQSKEVRKELKLVHDLAYSYFNIGIIHSLRGDLGRAVELYEQSYALHSRLGNIQAMGFTMSHIGSLLIDMGREEEGWAKLNQGLVYSKKGANPIHLSESLFVLFSHARGTGKSDLVQNYLHEMEQLREKGDHYIINLRYKLANAQYLMSQKRIAPMAEAKRLLEEIIHADVPDFEYQILALNDYCQVLIDEYTLFQTDDILEEIYQYLQKVQEISMENNLHILLVDAKVLLSKLTLVQGQVQEGMEILQEAHDLAQQYNLAYVLGKIDLEIQLLHNLTGEHFFQTLSTKEKLEHLRITDYLNSLGEIIDKLKSRDFLTD